MFLMTHDDSILNIIIGYAHQNHGFGGSVAYVIDIHVDFLPCVS